MTNTAKHERALSELSSDELAELASSRITIRPAEGTFEAWANGVRIARSESVLELHETGHDVRLYFPRVDVDLSKLAPIDTTSFCPFKGTADDYWALAGDSERAPAAWSYPEPIPASRDVAGAIAFYDSVAVARADVAARP